MRARYRFAPRPKLDAFRDARLAEYTRVYRRRFLRASIVVLRFAKILVRLYFADNGTDGRKK